MHKTIEMQAAGMDYKALNDSLRAQGASEITVRGVMGQRYLGCAMQDKNLTLYGTPGNGLGQYLSGGKIEVFGSAQEATGDTMNAGEIVAGGLIVVLGIGLDGQYPAGFFCGTGMHGGKIILRCDRKPEGLPEQVCVHACTEADRAEMRPHVEAYCEKFGGNPEALLGAQYFVLTPNPEKGYHRMYTSVI